MEVSSFFWSDEYACGYVIEKNILSDLMDQLILIANNMKEVAVLVISRKLVSEEIIW